MRKIIKIAGRELNTLFYSPVAWIILAVFTCQAAMIFNRILDIMVMQQFSRPLTYSVPYGMFSGITGVFHAVQNYLYLYIPLLSMGLMSREYSSGTIKLLYSSPVSSTQIVAGKFLSMMLYGLMMSGVLIVLTLVLAALTPQFDWGVPLSGILGIYLLLCTYSAIGLFMSALTDYQIVAAITTLAALAFLNQIGSVAQGIPLVQDLTYWLSIKDRMDEITQGLICSEDILYFLLLIFFFLSLTVMVLHGKKKKYSTFMRVARYTGLTILLLSLGYLSSRPALKLYYDATATQRNTLTKNSREVVENLSGELTITTYINLLDENGWEGLPRNVNRDKKRFDQYVRFKPDIRMKYVYYYADPIVKGAKPKKYKLSLEERAQKAAINQGVNIKRFMPQQELAQTIDLSSEGFRFVRLIERENGEKTFLRLYEDSRRHPSEKEISAALKRLTVTAPRVGFLSGRGERNADRAGDRDYYTFVNSVTFRYSLINNGFDVVPINLSQEDIPAKVNILMIADPQEAYTQEELDKINAYIARGGHAILMVEAGRQSLMQPILDELGVCALPGVLVQPSDAYRADLLTACFAEECKEWIPDLGRLSGTNYRVSMPGAVALEVDTRNGFTAVPVLKTPATGCWIEAELPSDTVRLLPDDSKSEQAYVTMLALQRETDQGEQRIVVTGDADWSSNAELIMSRMGIRAVNFSLLTETFGWMTHNEFPVQISRDPVPDRVLNLDAESAPFVKWMLMGVFPLLFILGCIICLFKRRGR